MSKLSTKLIGTREEFILKIKEFEERSPQEFLLRTKEKGNPVPVSYRRIQQYIDEGIISRGRSEAGESTPRGRYFFQDHLSQYLAAIRLKKSGEQTENISSIIRSMTPQEINELVEGTLEQSRIINVKSNDSERSIRSELRRLGRKEGRPLKSTQYRIALTPWCHVYLTAREVKKLTEYDVQILASAFQQALKNEILVSNTK